MVEKLKEWEEIDPKTNEPKVVWHYIYTDAYGYIDLQHFMEAASWQWLPDWMVRWSGYLLEHFQFLSGLWSWLGGTGSSGSGGSSSASSSSNGSWHSAYGREDVISNELGIQFANSWDPYSESLADGLQRFFSGLGPRSGAQGDPPGFKDLPTSEEDWQRRSRWYEPIRRLSKMLSRKLGDVYWGIFGT
jgi:hypothetical protein